MKLSGGRLKTTFNWFLVNVGTPGFIPASPPTWTGAGDRRIPVIVCAPQDEDQPRS
jgi:hypothetical protein